MVQTMGINDFNRFRRFYTTMGMTKKPFCKILLRTVQILGLSRNALMVFGGAFRVEQFDSEQIT